MYSHAYFRKGILIFLKYDIIKFIQTFLDGILIYFYTWYSLK